jgi:hypothetical protein
MCEAEENQGAGAGDKAKCHRVLGARRAATYGSIGMSGRAMGKRLCEAEENQGLEQATKLRLLPSAESLASLQDLWAGGCVKLKGFGRLC